MRILLSVLLFCFFLTAFSTVADDSIPIVPAMKKESRTEVLHQQDVTYDLGFLWLDKVAVANFKLQKSLKPGLYIASLNAKMVGIAASLTNNRRQQYVSMMRLMPDGSFRSVRHTSQIEKGGTIRAKVYLFDYEKQEVAYQYFKNNKLITEKSLKIESDEFPSDILTTYFNLVAGAFGPMEVGARYEVPAFSKKGIGNITIDFLPSDKRPKKKFFNEDLLICRVLVDQEVFDTKDGVIYIGYNENRLPARGIVADILGIGDVRGVMK
jgi:hypothetical protein